ncbi:mitochondrial carrier domain-containing protein [Cantharellus anzutake]|uniref:mitochondrial carrier domain-containing protein n=1 Tax=Cantharellus anzutake TaxID=1750568 RepID=UPI001903561E|nr:mitochondrial carrier domain-containing protein [Cantharellus anzutake]KAF8336334.1 mitochondrial carrier domain-containing protein [Cantharellus anzutake]
MGTALQTKPRPLSQLETFVCGGLAGCAAVTVSNPAEVTKTRLQLDAELRKGGNVYSGPLDVFKRTWKLEGIRGIQRGLIPAYAYQMLLNGSRLGFYEPLRVVFNRAVGAAPSEALAAPALTAGAVSGVIGAMLGNPLFLVKARMQAYSPTLPVGTQRYYKSSFDALQQIYKAEGLKGYLRGMDAAILRTGMGSSVQLPSYTYAKSKLSEYELMRPDSTWTFLVSSAFSGVCVCIVMQPGDTTLTRMYNQPTERLPDGRTVGLLYKSPLDCLWKTLRAEGIFGWYKGSVAHFLRISPHTIVTLTANEIILNAYKKIRISNPAPAISTR